MDEYIDAQWTPVGEPHTIRGNTGTIYTAQEYTNNKWENWEGNKNYVFQLWKKGKDAGALRIWQGYGRGTRFRQPRKQRDVPENDILRIVNFLVEKSDIEFDGDIPITIVKKGGKYITFKPDIPQRFSESER